MAENTTNYSTTQTFLIECSRADSLIDTEESADYNSKWTNATNFNLRRGDVVSVEAVTLSAKNASGAGTIEFSGDKVFIDGTEKPYCDNKVLLEVMFYMNNNNTYSCGLPFKHPQGSFNNNPANADMPIYNASGNLYYDTFPNTFGAEGYMSQAGVGGIVVDSVDATSSYIIEAYNTGTVATPNWVASIAASPTGTPVASIALAITGDPNPNNGLFTNFDAITTGASPPNVGQNNTCNILPGQRLAIKWGAGTEDHVVIPEEVASGRNQVITPSTGRLEIIFESPFNILSQALPASAPVCIMPNDRQGSSELGNICYDNIDQTGMSGPASYRRGGRLIHLAANNFGVPISTGPGFQGNRHNFFPSSTYGTTSGGSVASGNATVAYDYEGKRLGFRNKDIRNECNGLPYIWTRNDYFGPGSQRRNSKGFFPKMMPMTAFILLEADELFTDLDTLANKINDKIHEALSPFDNDISVMDNYVTNKVQEPTPQFKASSVIPVANTMGYYDPQVYDNSSYQYQSVYRALWTNILPIKYGGCTKVQPANFQTGLDYVDGAIGRFSILLDDSTSDDWYENAYLSETVTYDTYGKEARICNHIYGNMGVKEIYKHLMGDRLMRLPIYDMTETTDNTGVVQAGGFRNIGRPVLLNTRLSYETVQNAVPTAQAYQTITKLKRFQTLFLNIKFPTYRIGPNGEKNVLYDPTAWEDFAESLRDYELYTNKDPNTSRTTYAEQKLDVNGWSVNLDCGITDDYLSGYFNGSDPTVNLTPIRPGWLGSYPPAASINVSPDYGTGISNVAPGVPGFREVISPAFSQAIFGDSETDFAWYSLWNAYRGIGHVNVMSRFDPNWKTTSKEFSNVVAGQEDPQVKIIFDECDCTSEGFLDLDLMKNLDLPFVPAKYTDDDGNELIVCGLRVATNYGEDFDVKNTSTFQLGCLTWGLPIGVSPSFLDNHAIYPLNPDQRNATLPIKNAAGTSTTQPYRLYIENQTPYVHFGANNPTFQYSSQKNRFEFVNLQTDNLLSSLNQSANAPATNPQIGEKAGIIQGQQKDAVFNIPNPKTFAAAADMPTDPIENQGIRAEIGGVSIFKVWLCPPDYQVPENINPVNYWNNETLDKTEENRQEIIKGCIQASEKNWEGCLLSRLGFEVSDLLPRYGRQFNRFSPDTYNNPNPNIIPNATKPLILCNSLNTVTNPALNLYYKFPLPGSGDTPNGVPKFGHGFNENQEVILSTQSQPLTASNSPLLTNSSFFLIYSDIVAERNYQSGSTPLPCVFYAMKNYSNGGFLYAYGSNYNIMVNQDRLLSSINTEIRNPTDGKLAKLSPNSTIIYKIQRTGVVPNPMIDVFGKAEQVQEQPDPNKDELDKIFAEEKQIAQAIGGAVPAGSSRTIDRMRLKIRDNVRIHNEGAQQVQVGALDTPGQVRAEEAKIQEEGEEVPLIPEDIQRRALELAIQTTLNKLPVSKAAREGRNMNELFRALKNVFDKIASREVNMDMDSYWEASGGDPDRFLETVVTEFNTINYGRRGQILRSRENRGPQSASSGIVFATQDGLGRIARIIEDLVQERISPAGVRSNLESIIRSGGIILERPNPDGEGYQVINIRSGDELGATKTAEYSPEVSLRSLEENLDRELEREVPRGLMRQETASTVGTARTEEVEPGTARREESRRGATEKDKPEPREAPPEPPGKDEE